MNIQGSFLLIGTKKYFSFLNLDETYLLGSISSLYIFSILPFIQIFLNLYYLLFLFFNKHYLQCKLLYQLFFFLFQTKLMIHLNHLIQVLPNLQINLVKLDFLNFLPTIHLISQFLLFLFFYLKHLFQFVVLFINLLNFIIHQQYFSSNHFDYFFQIFL